ncbi:hypothetical protein CEXT_721201 [Caerostris extrusa]|uniref:Uncharacterized protein n=1 Tax=Caerostris extrusa TaxID=172846 RepID=A0AAV4REU7_CAEEX|nr:hypothetical protein CEXT_721201 [Caerostris extrusa]
MKISFRHKKSETRILPSIACANPEWLKHNESFGQLPDLERDRVRSNHPIRIPPRTPSPFVKIPSPLTVTTAIANDVVAPV